MSVILIFVVFVMIGDTAPYTFPICSSACPISPA